LLSLDINPLVCGQDGFIAVDALSIVRDSPGEIGS
jgi:hypothetical protein